MAPEFYTDWGKGEGRGNFLQTRAFSKCLRECKVGTVYGVGSVSSRHNTQALTLSQSPRPIYYYNCGIVFSIKLQQESPVVVVSMSIEAQFFFFNESCQNLQLNRDMPAIYLSLSSRGSQ